jgi:hypothetical protein
MTVTHKWPKKKNITPFDFRFFLKITSNLHIVDDIKKSQCGRNGKCVKTVFCNTLYFYSSSTVTIYFLLQMALHGYHFILKEGRGIRICYLKYIWVCRIIFMEHPVIKKICFGK